MKRHTELPVLLVVLATLALTGQNSSQTLTWEQTSGPLGGSPISLYVDPAQRVFTATYAGSGSSIVFRSTDAGERWSRVDLPLLSFNAFAENYSGHIFAATSEAVYRSTDGGNSWEPLSNGLDSATITSLAVNANDTIFAGSWGAKNGIFRSTDNGDSWSRVGLSTISVSSLTIDQGGNLYAGGYYSGVWKSTDGGNTWAPAGLSGLWVTSVASMAPNEVLAGLSTIASIGGLMRSTDGGATWPDSSLTGTWVTSVAPGPPGIFFAASPDSGLYRSTDDGSTWLPAGLPSANVLAVSPGGEMFAGVPSFSTLLGGSNGGVQRSVDGGNTWVKVGLPGTWIPALTIPRAGTSFDQVFAGLDTVVFRSTDNGDSWVQTGSMPHSGTFGFGQQALFTTTSGAILAGTQQWGVYRTTDDGTNWTQVGLNGETVYSFLESPGGEVYASTWSAVYLSTDDGATWAPTGGTVGGSWLSSLALSSGGELFVGVVNTVDSTRVYRSTDNGQTWIRTGFSSQPVMALLMTDGDTILAGCADFFSGGGVFRSTDNGATWTEVSSGLTNRLVQTLVRNGPGQLFAGTQAGVFRSTDNGDLWEPVNTGLTFPNIQSLSFNSSGVLFAGTFGGGVFRTTQSTTAVSEEEGETPVAFRLDQNYPNPFNPTSKIDFDMPEVGLVTLIVFDVLGQEVGRALDRRTFGPGRHSATIDAGELASGVYFYRLEVVDPAGGSLKFRTTMKMALVR